MTPGPGPKHVEGPLSGRTVAFLEARRSEETARLIQLQGGAPLAAPALRETPVEDDRDIRDWLDRLADGQFHVVLFLTGVGCRALLEHAAAHGRLDGALRGLASAKVVARGPKPVRVLTDYAVRVDFVPPEPNTSDELLAEFEGWSLGDKVMGVQLYGGPTPFLDRLRAGLAAMGARVHEVAPYRWEGPADSSEVEHLILECIHGRVDALAIFSSSQIHNLFAIAEEYDQGEALQHALNERVVVAVVGPVAAGAVESHGVRVAVRPDHPKLGHLVLALAEYFSQTGPQTEIALGGKGEAL